VIKHLMKIPDYDTSSKDALYRQTPLQLAAQWGTVEVVQHMMEHGVSEGTEPGPYSLLHLAAYGGKLDIVQYLIENRGHNPMRRDRDKKTVLHSACANGQLKVIKYLVDECKVDISNLGNKYHESPLDMAAKGGQLEIVKYLLRKRCIPLNTRM
jgi:ankyrin repeat protein